MLVFVEPRLYKHEHSLMSTRAYKLTRIQSTYTPVNISISPRESL